MNAWQLFETLFSLSREELEALEVVLERREKGVGYLTSTVWGVGTQGKYLVITAKEG